jgi:uncharacterized protein (TIGR02145 family)
MNKKNTNWIYPLFIIGLLFVLSTSCKKKDDNNNDNNNTPPENTVTDIDGNVYHYVTIGTQVWMLENLKVTKYRNGDTIPVITNNTDWYNLSTGAICDYNNIPGNGTTYGKLYNWYAANDSRKICPIGWHVPSDAEWKILAKNLDNNTDTTASGEIGVDIGCKLKESGTTHWHTPNTGSNNSSGFTALPGGWRDIDGTFYSIGDVGGWWTISAANASTAWRLCLRNDVSTLNRASGYKRGGFSIRCIKD